VSSCIVFEVNTDVGINITNMLFFYFDRNQLVCTWVWSIGVYTKNWYSMYRHKDVVPLGVENCMYVFASQVPMCLSYYLVKNWCLVVYW